MENLDKRSESRRELRQPVSLHSPDAECPVVGETRNLSSRGMFVHVRPIPPVGQELMCELQGQEPIEGRVAWILEPDDGDLAAWSGVGIEFADRSTPEHLPALEPIGTKVAPFGVEAGPVDVFFDGLASSTRAVAAVRDGAVELSSTLGFLKEGSEVRIIPAGMKGEPLQGRISQVFLRSEQGTPRLVISLALAHEVVKETWPSEESWFPEISISGPHQMHEPLVAKGDPEPTERNAVPFVDDVDAERPKGVSKSTLALAGLAVAVGAWAILRVGFPAGEHPEPLPVVTVTTTAGHVDTSAASARTEVAAATRGPSEVADEAPSVTAPAVAAAPVAAMTPPVPAVVAGPSWLPRVVNPGDTQQLLVPLTGNTKNVSRFVLDSPAGLAVNLPDANTLVPVRSYLLHDPAFYSLWVRRMPEGGLQIRLHVTKGVHISADIYEGNLRFRRKD